MCQKFTPDELNTMDNEAKNDVIYQMQDRLGKMEHDYENLIEQIRLANQQRYGRHSETLDAIAEQFSFFNEAEANCDKNVPEPTIEETIGSELKSPRKPKKKGQREENLKDFPQEEVPHDVSQEELVDTFGEGNWKSMPDEIFWQLRFEPAKWIAEKHVTPNILSTPLTLSRRSPSSMSSSSFADISMKRASVSCPVCRLLFLIFLTHPEYP